MISNQRELIKEQIRKTRQEVLFIKLIFSFVNCLSLVFVALIVYSLLTNNFKDNEVFTRFIEMAIALITPYLSMVSQGFLYPKSRNINVLRYLLFKIELIDEDIKTIYGK